MVNQSAAFYQAKEDLARLDFLAKQGDPYAIQLKEAYDRASPSVLGMPWPWQRKETE